MRRRRRQLHINVYPDIVGIGMQRCPSSGGCARVVAAMTAAYFAPSIGDAAVKTAQRDAAVLAVQQRYSTDLSLHDLLFKQVFSAGPAHFPATAGFGFRYRARSAGERRELSPSARFVRGTRCSR